jgi:hypothetical protein
VLEVNFAVEGCTQSLLCLGDVAGEVRLEIKSVRRLCNFDLYVVNSFISQQVLYCSSKSDSNVVVTRCVAVAYYSQWSRARLKKVEVRGKVRFLSILRLCGVRVLVPAVKVRLKAE